MFVNTSAAMIATTLSVQATNKYCSLILDVANVFDVHSTEYGLLFPATSVALHRFFVALRSQTAMASHLTSNRQPNRCKGWSAKRKQHAENDRSSPVVKERARKEKKKEEESKKESKVVLLCFLFP